MTHDRLSETETRPAPPDCLFGRTVLGIMCSRRLRRGGTFTIFSKAGEKTLQEGHWLSGRLVIVEG